jgi:hypothetical protein
LEVLLEALILDRAIEMIVDAKVRSKKDLIVSDIGLGPSDIEMMAVLPSGYFIDSAEIVPLEPKLKESEAASRSGKVVPFSRGT